MMSKIGWMPSEPAMSDLVMLRWCVVLITVLLMATDDPPQTQPAGETFDRIVKRLTDEARQSQQQGWLVRAEPDFAAAHPSALPLQELGDRMSRAQHDDPFVDAYIRWQLTSYQPKIETISDRECERALEKLPRLLPNPRSDEKLTAAMQRAASAGRLSAADLAIMNDRLNVLAEQASRAAALNQPAFKLRQWFAKQVPNRGYQACLVALESVAAHVRAGWPADASKAELAEVLTRSATDRRFTDDQRRDFLGAARKLVGESRMTLVSAKADESTISAGFAFIAVDDFEVRHWAKLLDPKAEVESTSPVQ